MIEVFTAVKKMVREEEEDADEERDGRDYNEEYQEASTFLPFTLDFANTSTTAYNSDFIYSTGHHSMYEDAIPSISTIVHMDAEDEGEDGVIYPLDDMLDDALSKGLVVADVTGRLVCDEHVSFAVSITMLDLPGLHEPYTDSKMFFLKKYTDFKSFYLDLSHVAEVSLPLLPSREIMSMGINSDKEEEFSFLKNSFLNTRQMYLKNWLNNVLMRQSTESTLYRQVIKNFLKCC